MMINYWAVLVAAIAAMIIGGIWWGPLFGKMWMRENGFDRMTPEQQSAMKKGMTWMYIQQLILSLIQAWVIAFLLQKLDRHGAMEGIKYGVLFWLGFMFPIQYGNKLWGGKGFKFVFTVMLNGIITLAVMGAILGAW